MKENSSLPDMLDLMVRPGFYVQDQKIVKVNAAAAACMICEDTDVTPLLHTGKEEYAAFTDGCLYLSLEISGVIWGAWVYQVKDHHVFLLEQESDQPELQALELAATELRGPLSGILAITDSLQPLAETHTDPHIKEHLARLNQQLYQLHRLVNNMSDAKSAGTVSPFSQETINICALLDELFEKAASLAAHTGIRLTYTLPDGPIFMLGDLQKLERAVWNILSNALKFTPTGGFIEAVLKQTGNQLQLSIRDSGSGIAEQIRGSLHRRYTRQPGLEDSRFGIGLGMVLIRSAAMCHGGTVLIDQPEGFGTRVTMTLAIRRTSTGLLRTPVMRVDYTGERDHALLELSESLPFQMYSPENLK